MASNAEFFFIWWRHHEESRNEAFASISQPPHCLLSTKHISNLAYSTWYISDTLNDGHFGAYGLFIWWRYLAIERRCLPLWAIKWILQWRPKTFNNRNISIINLYKMMKLSWKKFRIQWVKTKSTRNMKRNRDDHCVFLIARKHVAYVFNIPNWHHTFVFKIRSFVPMNHMTWICMTYVDRWIDMDKCKHAAIVILQGFPVGSRSWSKPGSFSVSCSE